MIIFPWEKNKMIGKTKVNELIYLLHYELACWPIM